MTTAWPRSLSSDKLNKEINAGLADPKVKTQLVDLGGIILGGSSADFKTLRNREMGEGDPGGQHQAGVARPPADVP